MLNYVILFNIRYQYQHGIIQSGRFPHLCNIRVRHYKTLEVYLSVSNELEGQKSWARPLPPEQAAIYAVIFFVNQGSSRIPTSIFIAFQQTVKGKERYSMPGQV